MAGSNRRIDVLFVFLTQVFDCLDSFGVIRSPCHKCTLANVHSGQASSCVRTVAARTTWQCKSCPHSRRGPDVCRCLQSILQLVEILCFNHALEIAWRIGRNPFLKPFLKQSFAWRYSRCATVVPQRAWRDPFKKKKT